MERNTPDERITMTEQDKADDGKLFGVYDETLQRFTGGTHPTRSAANDAKSNGPSGHKLVVRELEKS